MKMILSAVRSGRLQIKIVTLLSQITRRPVLYASKVANREAISVSIERSR